MILILFQFFIYEVVMVFDVKNYIEKHFVFTLFLCNFEQY